MGRGPCRRDKVKDLEMGRLFEAIWVSPMQSQRFRKMEEEQENVRVVCGVGEAGPAVVGFEDESWPRAGKCRPLLEGEKGDGGFLPIASNGTQP